MSTYSEIKEIPERFQLHRDKLESLFREYDIKSIGDLKEVYKKDEKFQIQWKEIWTDIAKADGGKLSLTTFGVIVGSLVGGVGIAAMGGAIGIPLAIILGLGGFLVGTKVDDNKLFSEEKNITIS